MLRLRCALHDDAPGPHALPGKRVAFVETRSNNSTPSAQHAGMPSRASHHCHQSCFTFSHSWQPCAQGWTLLRGSGPGATVRAAQLKLCHPKAEPRPRLLMESCLPARHTRDERPRRVRRHDLPRARRGASPCLDSGVYQQCVSSSVSDLLCDRVCV